MSDENTTPPEAQVTETSESPPEPAAEPAAASAGVEEQASFSEAETPVEDTTPAATAESAGEETTGELEPIGGTAEADATPETPEPVAGTEAETVAEETPAESEPAAAVAEDEAPAGEESPAEGETPAETEGEPAEAEAEPTAPPSNKKWYVVKIQSGREESIKAAIERKVKIEGLEEYFGQIAIPTEEYVEKKKVSVKDKKTGQKVTQEKNVVKHRKKFPGYLFAEVEFNDRILYLFRETSGVGDFVGGAGPLKPPPPMSDREVQTMLTGIAAPGDKPKKVAVKLDFEKGDKVRVKDGAFAGSEAEVKAITMPKDPTDTPKVTVVVTIWGRPVEMEMDYWHVDKI